MDFETMEIEGWSNPSVAQNYADSFAFAARHSVPTMVKAVDARAALPARFFTLYNRWFLLGWPAFFMMLGIYWLMVVKPGGAYCLG